MTVESLAEEEATYDALRGDAREEKERRGRAIGRDHLGTLETTTPPRLARARHRRGYLAMVR